ncbi:hypothetical protein A2U01_0108052, partial [Trifolium medium]|nr:hypothetical protein [Trifolium medium]
GVVVVVMCSDNGSANILSDVVPNVLLCRYLI